MTVFPKAFAFLLTFYLFCQCCSQSAKYTSKAILLDAFLCGRKFFSKTGWMRWQQAKKAVQFGQVWPRTFQSKLQWWETKVFKLPNHLPFIMLLTKKWDKDELSWIDFIMIFLIQRWKPVGKYKKKILLHISHTKGILRTFKTKKIGKIPFILILIKRIFKQDETVCILDCFILLNLSAVMSLCCSSIHTLHTCMTM